MLEDKEIQIDKIVVKKGIKQLQNGMPHRSEGTYSELSKNRKEKLYIISALTFTKCINWEEIPEEWQ